MTTATLPGPLPEFEEVPVIVAPKGAVTADAKNRAFRTLLQGFAIDLLIALGTTAYTILNDSRFAWGLLGLALAKTGLTTLVSYIMRIKMGSVMMSPNTPAEPVRVSVGGYELELQRPGRADHAADQG